MIARKELNGEGRGGKLVFGVDNQPTTDRHFQVRETFCFRGKVDRKKINRFFLLR